MGSQGVEVAIRPTGSLAGKVTIAGGDPPERFIVQVSDLEQGLWRRESYFRTSGSWTVAKLPSGTFKVSLSSEDGDALQEDVQLGEAEAKTGIDLELVARITLEGTMVDAETGEPVPDMTINATGASGGIFINSDSNAKKNVSDDQGRFENAPSADVRVTAFARSRSTGDNQWA